jgi:hypothetical protein
MISKRNAVLFTLFFLFVFRYVGKNLNFKGKKDWFIRLLLRGIYFLENCLLQMQWTFLYQEFKDLNQLYLE